MKVRLPKRRRRLLLVAGVLAETLAMRARGYPVGGNLIVRCRRGHLFTTLWVPGASVKALRLGWARFQWCPVGRHWSLVTPVRDSELTAKQKRGAHSRHDLRLP
jgi:hypothetical protein